MGGHWKVVVCSVSKHKEMDEEVELFSNILKICLTDASYESLDQVLWIQNRDQS